MERTVSAVRGFVCAIIVGDGMSQEVDAGGMMMWLERG